MPFVDIPLQLTSTAIKPTDDGNYSYDQGGLLIPHEALRREMARGRAAFEHFDVVAHPWRALYVKLWLHDFLMPSVHEHHSLEENILTPEMAKLGVVPPPSLNGAHVSLIDQLTKIEAASDEVLSLVRAGSNSNPEILQEKAQALKTLYVAMHDHMLEHFAEEETIWAEKFASVGEKEVLRIETIIKNAAQREKTAQLFIAAILASMGFAFSGFPFQEGDTRWCSEKTLNHLLSDIPYPVRAMIFPGFNKRYQRYKTMISSVSGDKDVLMLYHPDGSSAAGCSCTIA